MFKLTAHDMKSALVNEKLENHGSQKYSSKRVKVVNTKPTDTPSKVLTAIQASGNNPNDTAITVPITTLTSVIKKGIKPHEPPKNTSHLKDPIITTTNLDEACPLDTSCDHLIHLDSPSLSSELQDNSSVDSVEIEFLPESEGQLDHTYLSPTDVFSEHHDYELFLLQNEFDAQNDNPNQYDIHTCENQDDILIHATIPANAKLKDFFTQELWGGLPERTSSTTLRSLNNVDGEMVHHLELQKVQAVWITNWTNRGTPHLLHIQSCVQTQA